MPYEKKLKPEDSIERMLSSANFRRPTRFQRYSISEQLKGSSAIYEAVSGDGKTVAYCAPAVFRAATRRSKTVILCLEEPLVERVLGSLRILDRAQSRRIQAFSLQQQVRNKVEAERLFREWDVAVGTPEKAIDAIRIGGLSLSGVANLVIDCGESVPGPAASQDIAFVLSKLPRRRGVSILTARPAAVRDALRTAIPNIRTVERSAWNASSVSHRAMLLPQGKDAISALSDIIFARSLEHLWILCENSVMAESVATRLSSAGIPSVFLKDGFRLSSSSTLTEFSTGRIRALVTTSRKSCSEEDQAEVRGDIVFVGPFYAADEYFEISRFLEGARTEYSVTTLVPYNEREKLQKIEEMINVDVKKDAFPANEEVMQGIIASYLEKIKHDENPDDMNRYRKLIQRTVPFFMRSYFAAYLFKQFVAQSGRQQQPGRGQRRRGEDREERGERGRQDGRPVQNQKERRPEKREERPARQERQERPEPMVRLPEDEAVTLFVGIGKNRRVYAKDILQLFGTVANVDRSHIGTVKIMDNYSFIQISTEVADDAIAALNGADFRGRKLIVNFARKKGQSEESAAQEERARSPLDSGSPSGLGSDDLRSEEERGLEEDEFGPSEGESRYDEAEETSEEDRAEEDAEEGDSSDEPSEGEDKN